METTQEQWNELVRKIEELGDELFQLAEDQLEEDDSELESSLMGLRHAIDHLREQEV